MKPLPVRSLLKVPLQKQKVEEEGFWPAGSSDVDWSTGVTHNRLEGFDWMEGCWLVRLVMNQEEELQTGGRGVESESMKSDLSDCQKPFYSSTEQEENRLSSELLREAATVSACEYYGRAEGLTAAPAAR
ncbi:hypothetical protein NQZ68_039853 [Dissostichus eleginoides]|nr:hypothetical protein NQZ68_039853 [Dissostichus eleginoides]